MMLFIKKATNNTRIQLQRLTDGIDTKDRKTDNDILYNKTQEDSETITILDNHIGLDNNNMSLKMPETMENTDNATTQEENNSDVQFTLFLENIDADEYESKNTSGRILSDNDHEEILVLVGERNVPSNKNVTSTISSIITP